LNCEFVPIPFADPDTPEPAKGVTVAVEISTRRILLFTSVTNAKSPLGEMSTPEGAENLTFVPIPFTLPLLEPAKVVTEAEEMSIWRILLLVESATRAKRPFGEMLTSLGLLNFEFVPMPFVFPELPEPAKVETDLVEMTTLRMR
jgi:hypothetical protein